MQDAAPAHVFELLGDVHRRAAFSCGVEPLDRYFRQQARQDQRRHLAAVFVLRDVATSTIVGFYTLCSTSITGASLPENLTHKLPRYPHFPAILIGRLAVALPFKGRGFGADLLIDALRRAASTEIAAMAVVVEAKDDGARSFYERFGFLRYEDHAYRLYLPMQTVKTLVQG